MARQASIAIRISPEVRDALRRAAADDDRSIAGFVEHELRRLLAERGYLPRRAEG